MSLSKNNIPGHDICPTIINVDLFSKVLFEIVSPWVVSYVNFGKLFCPHALNMVSKHIVIRNVLVIYICLEAFMVAPNGLQPRAVAVRGAHNCQAKIMKMRK
jgi:hypothetical protein